LTQAPGPPVPVYVAAGSNVEPERNLRQALGLLRASFPGLSASRAYRNRAVGFSGADFLNLVVGFSTDLPLAAVLERLHEIETLCGRPRAAPKYAPRAMDLDVLLYGDAVGEFPGAILPRPDLVRRAYMLGPLAELAPDLVHPTLKRRIGELWSEFDRADQALVPVAL
jgi:2-amino-4-hydroxy-6-hydroxymethyldihydropteridine diphosphokinase